jgi:COMPASS component SWD2
VTGSQQGTVPIKKFGVSLVRFTKTNNNVLCASKNDWDQSIRYLSVSENSYLRYFSGHRDAITSISVSTTDETFISAALDETVRLWDLRAPSCQGYIQRYGKVCVTLDPNSILFAVASDTNTVSLYDRRSFDKAPFSQFQIDSPPVIWRALEFSPNGQFILLLTENQIVFLIDAFTGSLILELMAPESSELLSITFTPDSEFAMVGTSSGSIFAWELKTGKEAARFNIRGSVGALKWNPQMFLFAAADDQLHLFVPQ